MSQNHSMSLLLNCVSAVISVIKNVRFLPFKGNMSMDPGPLHGFWLHQGPRTPTYMIATVNTLQGLPHSFQRHHRPWPSAWPLGENGSLTPTKTPT